MHASTGNTSHTFLTDIGFHQVTSFCPNLQSLQLHDGTITSQSIWVLGQRCLHSGIFTALGYCPMEKLTLAFNDPLPLESNLVCYDLLTDLSLKRAPFIQPRLTHLTLEEYDDL